jgi:hypothetical protein
MTVILLKCKITLKDRYFFCGLERDQHFTTVTSQTLFILETFSILRNGKAVTTERSLCYVKIEDNGQSQSSWLYLQQAFPRGTFPEHRPALTVVRNRYGKESMAFVKGGSARPSEKSDGQGTKQL